MEDPEISLYSLISGLVNKVQGVQVFLNFRIKTRSIQVEQVGVIR